MYGVGPSEDTGRIKDGFENIYRSEYFKTALSTNVGDNSKSINVSEFSFEVLSIAVDFMYGIEIPESFNKSEDLKSLLHLADLYLMEDLKTAAGLLIAYGLNKDNVFDVSLLADKFRAEALRNKCVDYLFDNASSIDGEKFSVLSEGAVMASLAKKFVLETKKPARRPLWITKLFGEEPDFKKREDFPSLDGYDDYVVSKIQRGMFVSCRVSSHWEGVLVEEGDVGVVVANAAQTAQTAQIGVALRILGFNFVSVKWLTKGSSADPPLVVLQGPCNCLDLVTSPVSVNFADQLISNFD